MDELSMFCLEIKEKFGDSSTLTIEKARELVRLINDFLYTNYTELGYTEALGKQYPYISDFHKYWEIHHKEILNVVIDESNCEKVAEGLHNIYVKTKGKAFTQVWDTCNLSKEDICRIRLLTANQDFNGSRSFSKLAEIFKSDNTIFDEKKIFDDPSDFLKQIKVLNLSQNDKRITFAKKIAEFVLNTQKAPHELISFFNNDISKLREALINNQGAGYGNKKTDMFIRDMVVLGIWKNANGFEDIDVASDVNTIKVSLRTGILKTSIPLVSSFLDIFCHQYGYIDKMNALAWRKVWEKWKNKIPTECIDSPCLMDYFVYNVIGKQFCKETLAVFKCNSSEHTFKWHSSRNQTCQLCYKEGRKNVKATCINKIYPCDDSEGEIAILHSDFVSSLKDDEKFKECPFKEICNNNGLKNLQPPKSISILGKTGWISSYTKKGNGGGGLMA